MSIGNVHSQYALWLGKKRFQIFARTHLSAVLALSLAILVTIREWHELAAFWGISPHKWINWLIPLITIGTILTACWELVGNKQKISHQEALFLYYLGKVLGGLDKLTGAEDDDVSASVKERLGKFTRAAVNAFSSTFSGSFETHAGVMNKQRNKKEIKLGITSAQANYQEDLLIPLVSPRPPNVNFDNPRDTGPAGIAYETMRLVYVPKKQTKEAFPFRRIEAGNKMKYETPGPYVCWIGVPADKENFRTALCVPISAYQNEDNDRKYGVLNFSTNRRDLYVDRDFMMAECFAKILGIANRWAEKEQNRSTRPRKPS